MKSSIWQFVKFGLVGLSNTLISYVTFNVLSWLGIHYLVSNAIAFFVSAANAFYWNNKYVFQKTDGEGRSWSRAFIKCVASYAFSGLLLSSLLLILWIDILHIPFYIAPILNLAVTIPLNYVMNKFWAFRE